jgi:hypothetical protein
MPWSTTDLSIEVWFYRGSSYPQAIYSDGGAASARGLTLSIVSNTVIGFYPSNGTGYVDGTVTVPALGTTWHHLVVSVNRTTGIATVYLDAVSAGTIDCSAKTGSWSGSVNKTVGAYYTNTSWWHGGAIAGMRLYVGNALTAADVATLYRNKEPVTYANLPADIKAKLGTQGADWPLTDEPGSTYQDLHGSNDLTFSSVELLSDTGFEARAGITGASFAAPDKAHLECAHNAAFDLGAGDVVITANLLLTTTGSEQQFIAKYQDGTAYWFCYVTAGGGLGFYAQHSGGSVSQVDAAGAGLTTATKYHVAFVFDRSNTANNKIYVNGVSKTLTTNSLNTSTLNNTGKFYLGQTGSGVQYFNGRLAMVGIGKPADASDAAVATALGVISGASGLGQYYNEQSSGDKTTLAWSVFYDLTEASGTRRNFVNPGTNDLTEYLSSELVTNGTFTQANGPPTGWTNIPSYLWDTCSVVSNALSVIKDTTPAYSGVNQQLALTSGRSYTIGASLTKNSGGKLGVVYEATSWGSAAGLTASLSSTNLSYSATFTATASNGFINFYSFDADTATDWLIDNVTIKAASIPCVSDANVYANWNESGGSGAFLDIETVDVTGTLSSRLRKTGTGYPQISQLSLLTSGNTYIWSLRHKGASQPRVYCGDASALFAANADWDTDTATITADQTYALIVNTDVSGTVLVDSASLKATKLQATNGPSGAYASDSSGNGYHATLTGFSTDQIQTAWVPRGDGLAFTFTGTTDAYARATVPANDNSTAWTVSCKLKSSAALAGNVYLFDASGPRRIMCWNIGGKLAVWDNSSFSYFGPPLNDGAWHTYTLVADGTSAKCYVDGVQSGTTQTIASGSFGSYPSTLAIGGAGSYIFNGQMDDARIYKVALTEAQVIELAAASDNQEVTGATAIGWWRFNDGPPSQTASDGEPVAAWESIEGNRHIFRQTNILKRPKWILNGLNGRPVVRFDGVDDYMSITSNLPTGEAGTIVLFGQLTSVSTPGAWQYVLSQADPANTTRYLSLILYGPGAPYFAYEQRYDDTGDLMFGNTTTIVASKAYCLVCDTGGTAGKIRFLVNGVVENVNVTGGANNGDWFADVPTASSLAIGALVRSSIGQYAALDLAELIIYNRVLSASELARELAYSIGEFGVSP